MHGFNFVYHQRTFYIQQDLIYQLTVNFGFKSSSRLLDIRPRQVPSLSIRVSLFHRHLHINIFFVRRKNKTKQPFYNLLQCFRVKVDVRKNSKKNFENLTLDKTKQLHKTDKKIIKISLLQIKFYKSIKIEPVSPLVFLVNKFEKVWRTIYFKKSIKLSIAVKTVGEKFRNNK